ncbi:MAG: class I SAM-dependent methyltransferase [Bacteroidota bacterium]
MLKQHANISERHRQQVENSRTYVLPFVEEIFPVEKGMYLLEVGCDAGGVLEPFMDKGAKVVGVDLRSGAIERAKALYAEAVQQGRADFRVKNVYDADFVEEFEGGLDLILLKDTIEHIPEQEKMIPHLKRLLRPGGKIFFGFPPWYMPFGGHQQICQKKLLSTLPYYHLLPRGLYKGILKAGGENETVVRSLMEIKDTGISIERFERIIGNSGLEIQHKTHFLINPIYLYKFGWKPKEQAKWVSGIPFIRNFVTTCVWYVVG